MIGSTEFDGGHAETKWIVDLETHTGPSLVKQLSKNQFEAQALAAPGPNPSFIYVRNRQRNIDGYFAVGYAASDYGAQFARERRYVADYAGVLLCAGWARHYHEGQPAYHQQRVTALFPVSDWHAVEALRDALSGNWLIRVMNGPELKFSVAKKQVVTIPEALSGFLNLILDDHGHQRDEWYANGFNPMIWDIGAGTFQVVPLGMEYQPLDEARIGVSYPVGVNEAVEHFIQKLYHLRVVGSVEDADRTVYRRVIQSGRWTLRGHQGLANDIETVIGTVLDDLMTQIRRYIANHDIFAHSHIILTGGGSGLLIRPLVDLLIPDEDPPEDLDRLLHWAREPGRGVILADDLESIHLANVRGAHKARQ